jgi:hypothetical protein
MCLATPGVHTLKAKGDKKLYVGIIKQKPTLYSALNLRTT